MTRGGGGGSPGTARQASLPWALREIVAFYRSRPVLGLFVALLGLALAALVAVLGTLDRPVAAVALALMLGLVVGGAIAAAQRPDDDGRRPEDW